MRTKMIVLGTVVAMTLVAAGCSKSSDTTDTNTGPVAAPVATETAMSETGAPPAGGEVGDYGPVAATIQTDPDDPQAKKCGLDVYDTEVSVSNGTLTVGERELPIEDNVAVFEDTVGDYVYTLAVGATTIPVAWDSKESGCDQIITLTEPLPAAA